MKKLTPKRIFIFWLVIYLAALSFGCLIASAFILNRSKNISQIATNDRNYYVEHDHDFNPMAYYNGMNQLIYDENQILIDSSIMHYMNDTTFDIDAYGHNMLAHLGDKDYYQQTAIHMKLTYKIATGVALPMPDGGYFVLFKEENELSHMITVVFFTISLLVVLCATYMQMIIVNARKNDQMQRKYVDNISHELKSPISSVRALTETMYDDMVPDPDKRKQYYRIILNEINRLEKTVTNMLELSRIQSNTAECEKTHISAAEVFSHTLERYQALADDLGLNFQVMPDVSYWPDLYTNPSMAARILDILLNNAVKFAGVEGTVSVSLKDSYKNILISIWNTGDPILPEDQPLIFERFFKGDKSHSEKGSGLGLSIANELASSLNEEVWLSHSNLTGTEFCFSITKSN